MEDKAYKTMAENERKHWWFCGRRIILASVLKKIIKDRVQRALDIGSGTGGTTCDLLKFSKEVYGLEPSIEAIAYTQANYPELNIIQGFFPEKIPAGQFDLITILDVLEHIKDDRSAIEALSNLLSPSGVAVITVPAFPFLWSSHDEHLHHFRRYTISKLKKLIIENKSLSIQYINYYNSILFFIIVLVRLFHKVSGIKREGDDEKIPGKMLNCVLKKIFSFERLWLPNRSLPFGVSIICVIKKINI
jgi:SAM-dependent methyltransferase